MEGAGVIHQLPPDVIKRIAAGEIIVRPSSAIKELIENSIDAGATEIRINMSTNPLDFCEIIDNGCGVSEKDLLIICKRYTTSKTRDSIDGVKSLGFRGEALSSLSQSAHVTISSRTESESRRTVLRYSECEPLVDEIAYEDGPRGFYLKYENLFYNYETRHKSLLSNLNFEFNTCLQLIQKYSINFPNIKFVFNKINSNVMKFSTTGSSQVSTQSSKVEADPSKTNSSTGLVNSSPEQDHTGQTDAKYHNVDNDYYFFSKLYPNTTGLTSDPVVQEYISNVEKNSISSLELVRESIKNIYGLNVSKILHEIVCNNFEEFFFNCKGLISHPNQMSKVDLFILYINNRLIDLPQLKNLVYNTYNEISNNKYRRFIYLSIFLPYNKIDANIHPSKRKIMMESQTEIVLQIINDLSNKLNELIKVTNSVTTFSNTNKLVTEYHVNKESLNSKFKSRINAKQTNIAHFVTPLFSSTSGTSAPTFTYFEKLKREQDSHQRYDNNGSDIDRMRIASFKGSVQEDMNIESYKSVPDNDEREELDEAQSSHASSDYGVSNSVTVHNNVAQGYEQNSNMRRELGGHESSTVGRGLEENERTSYRDEFKVGEGSFPRGRSMRNYDDEEIVKDKNLIEKYDFNVLRIKYMNKINNFSYSKVINRKTLGNIYSVKEVQELIEKMIGNKDEELTRIVLDSSYVGMIDKTNILVHHKTDLIMLNIFAISKECCYQSIIWRLNNLPSFKLSISIPLVKLLSHSIKKYNANVEVYKLVKLDYIKMLNVLFGFQIKDFVVYKIPDVLNGYFPGAEYLSDLFYSLFTIECSSLGDLVVKFAKSISHYYLQPPLHISPENDVDSDYENFACRVLFSSCQRFNDLLIPKEFNNNSSFIKLANINLLHKIFERC